MAGIEKTRDELIQEYADLGNNCAHNKKYNEAVVHYSRAILLDPSNCILLSNRSLVLLKVADYYCALEDANVVIEINPYWAKGYFRKAQVLCATYNLSDAIVSYEQALMFDPYNIMIRAELEYTRKRIRILTKVDEHLWWLGIVVPIIIALLYIIVENLISDKPTFTDPFLMMLFLVYVAVEGYVAVRNYRKYIVALQEKIHLRPNWLPNPDPDPEPDENNNEYEPRRRRRHHG